MAQYHELADDGVARVLMRYHVEKEAFLFGITGDVDNLALFVARNGRARAENLVDLINRILERTLRFWAKNNEDSIIDIALIPSGEEPLVVGLVRKADVALSLFDEIHQSVNGPLSTDARIEGEKVSITFGCAVIDSRFLYHNGTPLTLKMEDAQTERGLNNYFATVEVIRTVLARSLDKRKFHTLRPTHSDFSVSFRNLVYFLTLKHKAEISEILARIAGCQDNADVRPLLEKLAVDYGITPETYSISKLLVADVTTAQDNITAEQTNLGKVE
jgi:hypothetical protein